MKLSRTGIRVILLLVPSAKMDTKPEILRRALLFGDSAVHGLPVWISMLSAHTGAPGGRDDNQIPIEERAEEG
jgi:hypothetical protein